MSHGVYALHVDIEPPALGSLLPHYCCWCRLKLPSTCVARRPMHGHWSLRSQSVTDLVYQWSVDFISRMQRKSSRWLCSLTAIITAAD